VLILFSALFHFVLFSFFFFLFFSFHIFFIFFTFLFSSFFSFLFLYTFWSQSPLCDTASRASHTARGTCWDPIPSYFLLFIISFLLLSFHSFPFIIIYVTCWSQSPLRDPASRASRTARGTRWDLHAFLFLSFHSVPFISSFYLLLFIISLPAGPNRHCVTRLHVLRVLHAVPVGTIVVYFILLYRYLLVPIATA
jgi:hypothetical protein